MNISETETFEDNINDIIFESATINITLNGSAEYGVKNTQINNMIKTYISIMKLYTSNFKIHTSFRSLVFEVGI